MVSEYDAPPKPYWVGEDTIMRTGDEALALLATDNDGPYATPDGVIRVPMKRWQRAQRYERATWMQRGLQEHEDGNQRHASNFARYQVLPTHLGHLVEVGCGPFTNAVWVLKDRTADHVTLVDPLIMDYLEHPHCTYRGGHVGGVNVTAVQSMVEFWESGHTYDALVMVNVLFHCFDADLVLDTIYRALKPGGWLVFREWPRQVDHSQEFDVGHPLTPSADYLSRFINQFVKEYFTIDWYFIGRKP